MKEPETLRDHMLKKPDDLPNDDSLSERKSISDKPKVWLLVLPSCQIKVPVFFLFLAHSETVSCTSYAYIFIVFLVFLIFDV